MLPPQESRHLVKSLRARGGEQVQILNGKGAIFHGVLETEDPREAAVRVERVEYFEPRAPQLVLAQSLLKGKAVDEMLRDVITLGLARLIPLKADRSEMRLDDERERSRIERWTLAAIEACKQSGNPWLPAIDAVCAVDALDGRLTDAKTSGPVWKFVASLEPDARPLGETLRQCRADGATPAAMAVAIGPEGDFSPEEYARLRADGFLPVSLPGYIFRAGPAALVALAQLAMA